MPFGALLRQQWISGYIEFVPDWSTLPVNVNVSFDRTFISGPGSGTTNAHGVTDLFRVLTASNNVQAIITFLTTLSKTIVTDQHSIASALSNIAFDKTFVSGPGSGTADVYGFTDLLKALTTSHNVQAAMTLLATLSKTIVTDQHSVASTLSNIAFDRTFVSGPGAGTTNAYGATDLFRVLTTSNSIQAFIMLLTALSKTMTTDQQGIVDANSRTDLQYILDLTQPSALAEASQHLTITVTHAYDNSSNVTAASTIHVSDILSITTNTLNILTIEIARELLSATHATAACIPTLTLTNERTTTQSSLADALAMAYSLVTQHDIQFSCGSLLAATLALTLASGLNASVNIDILLTTDVTKTLGLDSTAGLTTEASIALSQALALSVMAQALAMAGLSAECVVSVSASRSAVSMSVKLPDGRCATIDADIRVLTVPKG